MDVPPASVGCRGSSPLLRSWGGQRGEGLSPPVNAAGHPQGWGKAGSPCSSHQAELLTARLDTEAGYGPWGCTGARGAAPEARGAGGAVWGT